MEAMETKETRKNSGRERKKGKPIDRKRKKDGEERGKQPKEQKRKGKTRNGEVTGKGKGKSQAR